MNSRVLGIACACLILVLPRAALPATTAHLHPDAIFEGDITELVIEYDSKIASLYALDTAPLEADFEVLDSRSRVIRLDGSNSDIHRMQWRLQLLPRHSGKLTVPPLDFGNQSSPSLLLDVKTVPDAMLASQAIFVELEAEPRSPYVGQQTRIVQRLFHNTPIRIDGFAEPEIDDASLFRDGEENIYFVDRQGGQFRVLERHVDIFPRAAGTLELPPAVFRGELREAAAVESNLPGRKISRRSESLMLPVREPPPEYAGRFWLPARDLEIVQTLDSHDADLEVGDSIDWELTLVARGLTAESLPENLLEIESENYKVYADQVVRSNRFEGRDLIGRLEQRFAVIVTGPGPVELPATILRWWDLSSESERQEKIEARHIGVARATAGVDGIDSGGRDPGELILSSAGGEFGRAQAAALLAVIGIVLASAWLAHRAFARYLDPLLRRRRIRMLLRQACLDNHAARARALVIEWGRVRWSDDPVGGLFAIGERTTSTALKSELARLDAALFAAGHNRWQGKRLWTLIAAENRRHGRATCTPPDAALSPYSG